MVEFAMEGRDHAARKESPFVMAFIEAMFFTECGDIENDMLPDHVGYCDICPDSLVTIRNFCAKKQIEMNDLLQRAYVHHYQTAAVKEGWSRVAHSGMFNAPIGHETRLADYESWQELCECEGIETGEAYDVEQAGHDLFMTYQGHGVGFWDRRALDCDGLGDELTTACGRGDICASYDDTFVHVEIYG